MEKEEVGEKRPGASAMMAGSEDAIAGAVPTFEVSRGAIGAAIPVVRLP